LIPGTGRSFLTAFKLAASCFRESGMKRSEREAASLTAILLAGTLNVHHAVYFSPSTIVVNKAKLVKSAGYVARMVGRDTHKGLWWGETEERNMMRGVDWIKLPQGRVNSRQL
jgi:protein-S-isoprenylcysteine O-methyltransferase Ste14